MAIYSVIVRNTVCEIGHLIKKQSAQDCEFKVVPNVYIKMTIRQKSYTNAETCGTKI